MIAMVLEILDWIRHYDVHGRLKYKFYFTFLYDYGDNSNKTDDEKREIIKQIREVSHSKWKKILQSYLISSSTVAEGESLDDAINVVSGALVDFFADLDVTPTDLALGLTLLRWQSLQWIGGHSRVPAENVLQQTDPVTTDIAAPLDLDVSNPIEKLEKNWLHISYLRRYSHLVNASYGWTWYVTENPCDCTAFGRLFRHLSCRYAILILGYLTSKTYCLSTRLTDMNGLASCLASLPWK
ncbi:unnamed protein product [Rodentolepis nana]|uniref:SWIM-type domain-containing protein n=1 Tax=Rodentolepis nana TaxID=102285 RepID=A0A0R3TST7_RODNA|nr:unnamed protein product [Rodentolepis nana]